LEQSINEFIRMGIVDKIKDKLSIGDKDVRETGQTASTGEFLWYCELQ